MQHVAGISVRDRIVLYRKETLVTGLIALTLGIIFIVAAALDISWIFSPSALSYIIGGFFLLLSIFLFGFSGKGTKLRDLR
ncbi:MAG: hypothetical protein LUQ17_00400 [Methanomicrobiales archaeon]|nr:hypothetical protein [Methanomicrobiales archaeon]